jgi:hypothetical protein
MPVDQMIRDSLRLSDLKSKLPAAPGVVDVRVEDYVDTDGEDALRVTVLLDEDVEPEQITVTDRIVAFVTPSSWATCLPVTASQR